MVAIGRLYRPGRRAGKACEWVQCGRECCLIGCVGRTEAGLGMDDLRIAHAAGADWRRAAKACLEQLGATTGANLGFVYVTDALAGDLPSILTLLREMTGVEAWVGTVGIGICATGREYFDEPALAVMVGRWADDTFRVFPAVTDGLEEFRRSNAGWLSAAHPSFGIVHVDSRNGRSPALIRDLARETSSFLVGGLTSSRAAHAQVADRVVDGGVSGVLFSAEVEVATGLTQGCSPVGPVHAVTGCQAQVLFELDGRPAVDVLKEDLGETLASDLSQIGGHFHAALPIAGSDTGDYLVRNLIGIDTERGWLAIAAELSPGEGVMFVCRDPQSAREDLGRMLDDVKRRSGTNPRGGVYYTCLARGPNLFGPNSEELGQIREALGEVPLVGFFGNGEVSHDRLYAYTGVLALFL